MEGKSAQSDDIHEESDKDSPESEVLSLYVRISRAHCAQSRFRGEHFRFRDGCSDLFYSQRAPAHCSEDGGSDDEDHRQSATHAKRPSPKKKKRGKQKRPPG